MKILPLDNDRYEKPPASPLVEATLNLIRDKVRTNCCQTLLSQSIESGSHPAPLVTPADIAEVEQSVLSSGHRYVWSAGISVAERPDLYQQADQDDDFSFDHPHAVTSGSDEDGRAQCGVGDNVVRYSKNVVGTARYIRTNERVLDYITNGVPENTIAVIDDSGGTLTAPIIEEFAGVICAGGTVRSHLGILSREYGIACVMNAKISGIKEGDLVEIEASAPAKTAEDYQQKVERVAKVWKLSK